MVLLSQQLYMVFLSFSIGLLSAVMAYAIYRSHSVILWGFIAGILPDFPHFLTFIGVSNILGMLVITHVLGALIFTILLVITDIILIELRILNYLYFLKPLFLPLKPLFEFSRITEKLEAYHAIPTPVRIQTIYVVSIISMIIHLSVNGILGVL